jgi:N-acetyl-gamma-glutamyl-phosphate reductase
MSEKLKVGVWGATGYTGFEIVRILLGHPEVEIVFLAAKIDRDTPIAEIFPVLGSRTDLICHVDAEPPQLDVALLALPHTISVRFAPGLLSAGVKVIDLSADYRLREPAEYEKWYGTSHGDTDNLGRAVYGLPEAFRSLIRKAALIANPGCYPTASILAIGPLLEGGMDIVGAIVDAKTGVSGGGRNPNMAFHFPECNESVKVYKVGVHQHEPEIRQVLGDMAQGDVDVLFVPHLVPMDRGILSTCYVSLDGEASEEDLYDLYEKRYADEPFVRVRKDLPSTKDVVDTNFCDIAVRVRDTTAIVISCVDNLLKGAAGQAIQNMNIMCGFPEETALV